MSRLARGSPFVQIKVGADTPPIFIAHGLSGTVQFAELAKHIRTDHPIFGIQAKGIDGAEEPFDRVEDMAEFYLAALEELYPRDPYILVGYSFGGLVALEMAQRLLRNKKRIALLVLLDTFPHPRFLPAPQRVRLFIKRMRIHAGKMRQQSLTSAMSYFVRGVKRRLGLAKPLHETDDPQEMLQLSVEEKTLRRVNLKAYSAYTKYKPKFYPGAIKFVTTETKTFFPGDPLSFWEKLAAHVEVEVIPGDHLNMVTTEFAPLAALITQYVQEVSAVQV